MGKEHIRTSNRDDEDSGIQPTHQTQGQDKGCKMSAKTDYDDYQEECQHESICMCAGRPECHECGHPFYSCDTIKEAQAVAEEWRTQTNLDNSNKGKD